MSAAGAVVAVARVNGLLGAGRVLTADQVADELDVTLGAIVVTERELGRVLNLSRYAKPRARGVTPDRREEPSARPTTDTDPVASALDDRDAIARPVAWPEDSPPVEGSWPTTWRRAA
jgi:hypothetical protein